MIPFAPFLPDQGPFSPDSTDVALNVVPISNGYGPFPSETSPTAALAAQCCGSWYVRTDSGAYLFFAATNTNIYKLGSGGAWTSVGSGYTGPDSGDLWQATKYAARLYLTNINDGIIYIDVNSGVSFAAAPGTPPKAKFIKAVGDFLMAAYLRVGATSYPFDYQHSAIDDPTTWTITGAPGASDRQTIYAGDEITGLLPTSNNGARIFQRSAKKGLIFNASGATAFEQRDLDTNNGVFAPYSIVDIGGDDYVYINEQGIFRGDGHLPIGLDRYSQTIIRKVDYDKIEDIQGVLERRSRRVLWRAIDKQGNWFVFGYDVARDKFFETDVRATLLTDIVGVATLIDDITGLVDSYTGTLVDSPIFSGGRPTSGCWLADLKMYSFAGSPKQATIETTTSQIVEDGGAFLWAVSVLGNANAWSVQVGHSAFPDDTLTWSQPATRSINGDAPFLIDDNYFRYRVIIPAGTSWTHAHGVKPRFKPSRRLG